MQTLEDFLRRYSFRRALAVFVSAQLIGTGLALGLANRVPILAAIPGIGIELLRGLPALLMILVVWLELVTRKIDVSLSLMQIFQRITRVDLAAIALFNLAIGILSILVILLGIHLFSPDSLREALLPKESSLSGLLIGAVTSSTLAPISEEIVFRGWLFNVLRKRLHVWLAIILSSLAFAAIHPSLSLITTFLFGVSAAIAYYKTQNLWASILIHALNNLLISAQSITEYILIQVGLIDGSTNPSHLFLVLGIPCLAITILLGRYLVIQKRFFNLLVPLSP